MSLWEEETEGVLIEQIAPKHQILKSVGLAANT